MLQPYTVEVRARGGARYEPRADLTPWVPWTQLQWGRVRSETSEASVQIGGDSDACRNLLHWVRPWRHELAILRGGRLVWSGPVVTVSSGLAIGARDASAWLDRRWALRDRRWLFQDASQVVAELVELAMEPDPSPGLRPEWRESGVRVDRAVDADRHPLIGAEVRELGRTGAAWTMVGSRMLIGPLHQEAVPELNDEHLAVAPVVTLRGLLQTNRQGVRGFRGGLSESLADPVWGEAELADSVQADGLLMGVVTEDTILDASSATAAARRRLGLIGATPATIERAILHADAPLAVEQMLPGLLLDVRLRRTFVPVEGRYRIAGVSGSVGSSGLEAIELTLEPAVDLGVEQ